MPSGGNTGGGFSGSAADITSGTVATARLGSGTASSTTYLRGDQTWATPGAGWTKLATVTAANDATIDFGNYFTTTYKAYALVVSKAVPATDNVDAWLRVSDDGGATFEADAADYRHARWAVASDASSGAAGSAGDTKIVLQGGLGSDVGEGFNATIMVYNPVDTTIYQHVLWNACGEGATGDILYFMVGAAEFLDTASVEGVQFLFSSGNVESGVFELYGIS